MNETPARARTGAFLFLPANWQRVAVLKWLKRVHAWTGFWGALLFLLMGTSGFFLNHRALLKIEGPKPVEVSALDVAVRPGAIVDADALGKWAQTTLSLPVEGKAAPAKDGDKRILGKALPEAVLWTRVFTLPDTKVTVTHAPGSASVSVKTEALGLLATIKNVHKGSGLGIAWVLFLDTIAGALIAMSLTGFLLWSRLHGPRLLAGAIMAASVSAASIAVWPYFAAG